MWKRIVIWGEMNHLNIGTNNLFSFYFIFLREGNLVALNPKASEIQRNWSQVNWVRTQHRLSPLAFSLYNLSFIVKKTYLDLFSPILSWHFTETSVPILSDMKRREKTKNKKKLIHVMKVRGVVVWGLWDRLVKKF